MEYATNFLIYLLIMLIMVLGIVFFYTLQEEKRWRR